MIRKALRWLFYRILQRFGLVLRDCSTGQVLAHVLPLPCGGKLRLIGLPDYKPIRLSPVLGPKGFFQSISLRAELLPGPDFPSLRPFPSPAARTKVLVVVLAHQKSPVVEEMLQGWGRHLPGAHELLLLHGGNQADCDAIHYEPKRFLADPQLRVSPQRLRNQSWSAVYEAAAGHLADHTHVFFAEYDLLPLDSLELLFAAAVNKLQVERAEVLFPLLSRVDGTCQELFLQQTTNPDFSPYWARISWRESKNVVLWALQPGSFWRADSVRAVAANPEPFPIYCEVYVPTLLHHLGFRVREWGDAPMRILGGGNLAGQEEQLRAQGLLAIHPVKTRSG